MTVHAPTIAAEHRWFPISLRAAVAQLRSSDPSAITLDVAAPAEDLRDALACGIAWCRLVGRADALTVLAREQTSNAVLALLGAEHGSVTISASALSSGSGVLRVTTLAPTRTEIEIDPEAGVATVTVTSEDGATVLPTVWGEPASSAVLDLLAGDRQLADTILGRPAAP